MHSDALMWIDWEEKLSLPQGTGVMDSKPQEHINRTKQGQKIKQVKIMKKIHVSKENT